MDSDNPDITEITYGKTMNIGRYESVRLDLTARVPAGKSYADVLAKLKRIMVEEEDVIRAEQSDQRQR